MELEFYEQFIFAEHQPKVAEEEKMNAAKANCDAERQNCEIPSNTSGDGGFRGKFSRN